MNKPVKIGLIVVGVLLVVCCVLPIIAGSVMSRTWKVETSVVIQAPPEVIFPHLNEPRRFVEHTTAVALETDPTTPVETSFSEQTAGPGAWWISESPGSKVRIEIVESDPTWGIRYEGQVQSDEVNDRGSILFEPAEGGTRVVWKDTGELPPVIGGLMAGFVSTGLEEFFHATLVKMKESVEAK